jgi:hypothetical protein
MDQTVFKKYALILVCSITISQAYAQKDRPLEERIEAQRIAFITQRVNLSPEEAQSFWPIYNEYREQEKALRADKQSPGDIMDMDEAEASLYINQVLLREQQELNLKKDYTEKLRTVISAKKIIRFYAAERMFKERLVQIMSQRRKTDDGR